MTRILCVSRPSVKPTRRTARPATCFGVGILPTHPTHRADYSAADEAWYLAELAAAEDRHFDRLADESAALDRLEAGLCV